MVSGYDTWFPIPSSIPYRFPIPSIFFKPPHNTWYTKNDQYTHSHLKIEAAQTDCILIFLSAFSFLWRDQRLLLLNNHRLHIDCKYSHWQTKKAFPQYTHTLRLWKETKLDSFSHSFAACCFRRDGLKAGWLLKAHIIVVYNVPQGGPSNSGRTSLPHDDFSICMCKCVGVCVVRLSRWKV